jgi:hypothetical protein
MDPAGAGKANVNIVTIVIDTIDFFISFSDLTVKFAHPKRHHPQLLSLSAERDNAMVNWMGQPFQSPWLVFQSSADADVIAAENGLR